MDREQIFLLPGEMTYRRAPTRIGTLLGSCVAVCLYDTHNHWGGMNHYMLPERQGSNAMSDGKIGVSAIEGLLSVARRAGSRQSNLVASVYGGGKVLGHLSVQEGSGTSDVGRRNIETARRLLREHAIPVVRHDVGGDAGRKIHMHSDNNTIEVRPIARLAQNVAAAEKMATFRDRNIRVLIIDDSPTVRSILRRAIADEPGLEVAGEAENPYAAREKILELDPDVLCLDIIMPRMDGLTFLKKIMCYKPIPTVIVSTIAKKGSAMRANVLQAGAVNVLDKDELEIYRGPALIRQALIPKLRSAAARTVMKKAAS